MKSLMGRSLDKDPPMLGPQAAERNEKGWPSERVSDLVFLYSSFFPEIYPPTWQGGQGCFATKTLELWQLLNTIITV